MTLLYDSRREQRELTALVRKARTTARLLSRAADEATVVRRARGIYVKFR
jgi:hypothetical protein